MSTPNPLESRPLYAVQRDALTDSDAAAECARRYVAGLRLIHRRNGTHVAKLMAAFLAGLFAQPNEYDHGRGGNFAAPYRRAYLTGAALRRELTQS